MFHPLAFQRNLCRVGLANLWHACTKWRAERFPWHATFTAVPIFYYFLCLSSVSILWKICVYIHISDCIEIVFELPFLPNNTVSETFLHISETMGSVDQIFVIRASACRWRDECVILDKIFYHTHSKLLAQMFQRETDDHPVPSKRAVAMFLLTQLNG